MIDVQLSYDVENLYIFPLARPVPCLVSYRRLPPPALLLPPTSSLCHRPQAQGGTALHCTALHCTALHCTAQHCSALR